MAITPRSFLSRRYWNVSRPLWLRPTILRQLFRTIAAGFPFPFLVGMLAIADTRRIDT
jgi:hypothetical protein